VEKESKKLILSNRHVKPFSFFFVFGFASLYSTVLHVLHGVQIGNFEWLSGHTFLEMRFQIGVSGTFQNLHKVGDVVPAQNPLHLEL
jgi:hypothetical protein